MHVAKFGELRAVVTGGSDGQGGGNGPVVVLLHGFGAPPDDLVSLTRVFEVPIGTRFVFPEAPLALEGGYGNGRAWWNIQIERFVHAMERGQVEEFVQDAPAGLNEAHAQVVGLLDEIEKKLRAKGESIVLGGFSQGAMLSCEVALKTARPLAGLMLMSTTILTEPVWLGRMPKRKGLAVFQSHGDADPLLPFMLAERLRNQLVRAGLDVTWCPFHGGHGIAEEAIASANQFLKKVFPA